MKEGWTYKKLGEVCEILNGFAFQSKNYVPEGIRVVRITNVQKGYIEDIDPKYYPIESKNELSRYLLKDGDLLLSLTGNVGRVAIIDYSYLPAYLNQRVACIRVKENVSLDLNFLFHLLYSKKFEGDCIKSSKGAAQLNMSTIWLASYLIPVPSIEEQLSIVAYLDAAFAHIDALKANAEKQLTEARQLFQAELTKCMRQKEGWEEKALGEVCIKSKNIKWDNVDEGKTFTYIDLTSVDRTDLQIHNPQIINKHNAPSRAKQIIHSGDIIFATTRPTLRRVSLIDEQYDGDICSTGFCVLRPDNNVVSEWIFYALQEEHFYSYIEPLQAGANYPAVTDGDVKNYAIPIPSKDTQHSIVSRLDALSANIKKLEEVQRKTLAECDALKQAMLREVFE